MSFAAFLLCPGHVSLWQRQHRRLFYWGCQEGDKERKQTGKCSSFCWQTSWLLYWGHPQWGDHMRHFNVDEGSAWLICFLTVLWLVCVCVLMWCNSKTVNAHRSFLDVFWTCINYFHACLICLYCWQTTCYIVINLTHYGKYEICAQLSFTVRCVSLPPSDVFVMPSTRCNYWVRREDVPENVSLLLRRERQSSDQRKSFTRDLPVNLLNLFFFVNVINSAFFFFFDELKWTLICICRVYCRKHRDASSEDLQDGSLPWPSHSSLCLVDHVMIVLLRNSSCWFFLA